MSGTAYDVRVRYDRELRCWEGRVVTGGPMCGLVLHGDTLLEAARIARQSAGVWSSMPEFIPTHPSS